MSARVYVRVLATLAVLWSWLPGSASGLDCGAISEQEGGLYGALQLVDDPGSPFQCEIGGGSPRPIGQWELRRCSDDLVTACSFTPQALAAIGITWHSTCDGPLTLNFCRPCNAPGCKRGESNGDFDPAKDPAKEAGDPVDVATGALKQTVTDLDLGGGLRFTRHYSSGFKGNNEPIETSMGAQWRHSLQWLLVRETGPGGAHVVRIREPWGMRLIFINHEPLLGSSFEGARDRSHGTLEGDFAGSLTYTDPSGTQVTFNSSDQVTSIAIPGEALIQVTYDGMGSRTYSNGNASLTITHHQTGDFTGKVQRISGGGFTVQYAYEYRSLYNLVLLDAVTAPDLNRNPAVDEVLLDYQYEDGSAAQLKKIVRTTSGGAPTLGEWTYQGLVEVKTADEPGLDQPLKFSYSTGAGNDEVTRVCEGSVTTCDSDHDIATVTSDDGIIKSIDGVGGPGYQPGLQSAALTPSGRWKTRTDAKGNKTLYEDHDERGQPGRIVDGWVDLDSSGTFNSGDGFAEVTEYTWHPRLNEPLTITRASNLTGQPQALTTFDYDADGNASYNQAPTDLVHARIENGSTLDATGVATSVTTETRFTYNADGKILTIKGPRTTANFTEHVYDPATGYRTATRRYLNGPTSSYLETTFGSFDARGNPETVTDPNGRVTNFTYDAAGRVKTVTPPFSGAGSATIEFFYDDDGRIDLIKFPLDSDTVPAPYTLDFGYNDKGKLEFIADSRKDAIVYEYGGRNRRIRASLHRDFVSLAERGALVGDAKFSYDGPGHLDKAFNQLFPGDPSPVYSDFGHDANGNTNAVVDENGKQDTLIYDALDRLTEVNQIRTATYSTGFQYDPASNVKKVTDAAGKQTDYLTDDLGRLVKVISPDTGTTIFNYDDAGNLIRKIEAFGTGSARTTLFEYDGLDRLTKIDLPTNADWVFTYDTDAAKNQKGRLAKATNLIVTTDLEYTARGQLAKESTTYNARRYDTLYTFDAAGNIATIQTPSGTLMTYRYKGSRVKEVDVTHGARTETIRGLTWLPFGPLDLAELPPSSGSNNVVTLDRTYNPRYQLTRLQVTGPGGPILDRSYSYTNTASPGPNDPGPNLDKQEDNLDSSESRFYFYDELDRLSRATDLSGANLFEYGHDSAGNRTFKTDTFGTTIYAYQTGTDRLEAATGAEQAFYANDAYGNRIYAGSTPYAGTPTYTYNEQNRLISTVTSQGTVTAVYDAFGRRVAWQTMRFVYDPAGRILEVSNRSGGLWWGDLVWVEGELLGRVEKSGAVGMPAIIPPAISKYLPRDPTSGLLIAGATGSLVLIVLAARRRSPRYAWASAGSAALVLLGLACVPTGLEFYWIYTDQIGFPVAMTNTPAVPGDAEVIWRASYEPFGLATEELDPDGDGKQVRMPLRFPGQWWDYAANLHYNFFRDYDPATGRYLEADPIRTPEASMTLDGFDISTNSYSYVLNDPNNFTDPWGDLRKPRDGINRELYAYTGANRFDPRQNRFRRPKLNATNCKDAMEALERRKDATGHTVEGDHVELVDRDAQGRVTFESFGVPRRYRAGLEGPDLQAWIRLGNAIQSWNRAEHESDHILFGDSPLVHANELERLGAYVAECKCQGLL